MNSTEWILLEKLIVFKLLHKFNTYVHYYVLKRPQMGSDVPNESS